MSEKYEIRSFRDVFEKVPAEKILICLFEIGKVMVYNKALAEQAGVKITDLHWPEVSTWIDDDKGEIGTRYIVSGTDEPIATVQWE